MEPVAKVGVTVTFLRMERRPSEAAPALPPGTGVVRLDACTVSFYRYLYNTVGADYLWWLRRTMPDRELAGLQHGMTKTQASARLFLVPGMHHCGGGPGPDQFDTLSAMENWVEHGVAPAAIVARTKPEVAAKHALKLCPYPQQGRYSGAGDVQDPANWACVAKAG